LINVLKLDGLVFEREKVLIYGLRDEDHGEIEMFFFGTYADLIEFP